MAQNNIPADVLKRIDSNANDYLSLKEVEFSQRSFNAYIAGATAEAERAQELKNLLDEAQALLSKEREKAWKLVDALEEAKWVLVDLYSDKGDSGSPLTEKIDLILQQWKDRKEVIDPCPHCGKELNRDRNLCCRECGKEVEIG